MMKRYTGESLRTAAKMLPWRATLWLGAPSARWTIYWSVHQYHSPMIGAQKSMPSHGKLPLKYQACLTTLPAASDWITGDHVPCTPAGMSGFQRLNMSEPHQ